MSQPVSLNEQIEHMTAEQAQQAILTFYELMPINQEKPTTIGIEARAAQLQEYAPNDLQVLLTQLTTGETDADNEMRGALAKALLQTFNGPGYEPFHDSVRASVEQALQPDMSIILGSVGAYLIVMALIPTKVQISKEENKWNVDVEFGNLKQFATLSDNLKEMLNKLLPSSLTSSFEKSSKSNGK
jgi:hypothetical protein